MDVQPILMEFSLDNSVMKLCTVAWNMLVDKYAKGSDVAMAEGRKIDPC